MISMSALALTCGVYSTTPGLTIEVSDTLTINNSTSSTIPIATQLTQNGHVIAKNTTTSGSNAAGFDFKKGSLSDFRGSMEINTPGARLVTEDAVCDMNVNLLNGSYVPAVNSSFKSLSISPSSNFDLYTAGNLAFLEAIQQVVQPSIAADISNYVGGSSDLSYMTSGDCSALSTMIVDELFQQLSNPNIDKPAIINNAGNNILTAVQTLVGKSWTPLSKDQETSFYQILDLAYIAMTQNNFAQMAQNGNFQFANVNAQNAEILGNVSFGVNPISITGNNGTAFTNCGLNANQLVLGQGFCAPTFTLQSQLPNFLENSSVNGVFTTNVTVAKAQSIVDNTNGGVVPFWGPDSDPSNCYTAGPVAVNDSTPNQTASFPLTYTQPMRFNLIQGDSDGNYDLPDDINQGYTAISSLNTKLIATATENGIDVAPGTGNTAQIVQFTPAAKHQPINSLCVTTQPISLTSTNMNGSYSRNLDTTGVVYIDINGNNIDLSNNVVVNDNGDPVPGLSVGSGTAVQIWNSGASNNGIVSVASPEGAVPYFANVNTIIGGNGNDITVASDATNPGVLFIADTNVEGTAINNGGIFALYNSNSKGTVVTSSEINNGTANDNASAEMYLGGITFQNPEGYTPCVVNNYGFLDAHDLVNFPSALNHAGPNAVTKLNSKTGTGAYAFNADQIPNQGKLIIKCPVQFNF